MDTFTASKSDKHPTDLAMLRGARLVTATETEEGRAWAESRIKQMTGGDTITARFMRQDFFDLHAAVQADDRRQPQAGPAQCRRGRAAALQLSCRSSASPSTPDRELEQKLMAEGPASCGG